MKTTMIKTTFLLITCFGAAGSLMAATPSIDVDFIGSLAGSSDATTNGYNPGAAGIGSASDQWNDLDISTAYFAPGNLPASVPLYDVNAILTSIHFTLDSGTYGEDPALAGTPAQNELFTPGFSDYSFVLSGLTVGTAYSLLLYGPDATSGVTVNGSAFPAWSAIGSSWGPSWVLGDGYNEMTVVVPSSGDLTISDPSGSESLTAFQIAPAPEPSACALAGLGGLCLVAAYRRRVGRSKIA